MRYELRDLNVGGVLDQAIAVVRDHFALLLGITAVLYIPFGLIFQIVIRSRMSLIAPGLDPAMAGFVMFQDALLGAFMTVALLVNGLVVYPLTIAAIVHALASEYLERPTGMGNAFSRAGQVMFPWIGTSILYFLLIAGGGMACFFPGLICAILFGLAPLIVVIEGNYGVAALRRSYRLIRSSVGGAIVLGILVLVIGWSIGIAAAFVPHPYVQAVVVVLLQTAVLIFSNAAWVVFYFSCRCRAENFDLALMVEAVARDDAPAEATVSAL